MLDVLKQLKEPERLNLERQTLMLEQELLLSLTDFEHRTGRAVRDIVLHRRENTVEGVYVVQPYTWASDGSDGAGRIGEPTLERIVVKLERLPLMSSEHIQKVLDERRTAKAAAEVSSVSEEVPSLIVAINTEGEN